MLQYVTFFIVHKVVLLMLEKFRYQNIFMLNNSLKMRIMYQFCLLRYAALKNKSAVNSAESQLLNFLFVKL